MCGIAGVYSFNEPLPRDSSETLKIMADILRHRGPDDNGEYSSEHCGLSFRRLAIIDLFSGQQPMHSYSDNFVIVFNGEIYNYVELREELIKKDYRFNTNSDTEVIAAGFEAWGAEIVNKLRGMFSFAIYDKKRNELFLARDHIGIKPLYYCQSEGNLFFASEIKALLTVPRLPCNIRNDLLPKYLSFLWIPHPDTFFESIYMLEPGHYLLLTEAGLKKVRYWNPDLLTVDHSKSEQDWQEILDEELRSIVKSQMVSDVTLGSFLSGGVDSSMIVAYMNQASLDPCITYTVGFHYKDISADVVRSDLEYSRYVSDYLNVSYNEIILSPDIADILTKIVWHMDEPVADPAAISTFLICKAAKEQCTVMLSGVGGDEIFGGYPRYLAALIAERYRYIPHSVRRSFIEPIIRNIPTNQRSVIRNAKKFIGAAGLPFFDGYIRYLSYYSQDGLNKLLKQQYDFESIFRQHEGIIEEYGNNSRKVQTMMNLDLKTFLPNLNLLYTDKMSSAASVEVRVPYLDSRLIEKMASMPDKYKINNLKRKLLFKKLAESTIPHNIVWRKKAGFGAPIGAWLKGPLREMMLDLLSEETIKKRGYFNYRPIEKLIRDHLSGTEYNANHIWQLLIFELWHQQFIDR